MNCIHHLHNYEIERNVRLSVSRSSDNRQLRLTNLPADLHSQDLDLVALLRELADSVSYKIVAPTNGELNSSMVVEYASHAAASVSLRYMFTKDVYFRCRMVFAEFEHQEYSTVSMHKVISIYSMLLYLLDNLISIQMLII